MLPGELQILCEDGPVIAVNKPSGIVVQGAPIGVDNLADLTRAYLKQKYDKPGSVYLGVPHRLDRPVSGVVVFSRNSKCAARLSEQFAKRQVRKRYLALLEGVPGAAAGELEDWLRVLPETDRPQSRAGAPVFAAPKVVVTRETHADAKSAKLGYQVLWTGHGRTLVEVDLHTGRMHQIRVQFSSRGWPIVGDLQYGSTVLWDGERERAPRPEDLTRYHPIALHAAALTILHPVRYDELTITAPLPATWRGLGVPAEWRT
ncbi:MAG: RNA pseudouridine synthase [Planctomycetaceae bacterium]